MAANGTIQVSAANGSQAAPKNRRHVASIDTAPATATMAQVAKKTRDAAHERLSSIQRCGLVAWRQQGDT